MVEKVQITICVGVYDGTEKQWQKKIKLLCADNGGKYTSKELPEYLNIEGIKHEKTVPKALEQNGVAERIDRTLVEITRAMLADSRLPKHLLAEILSKVVYLQNHSPARSVQGVTSYEVCTRQKPNVNQLRVNRCNAYVHFPKSKEEKWIQKQKDVSSLGMERSQRIFDCIVKRKEEFSTAELQLLMKQIHQEIKLMVLKMMK